MSGAAPILDGRDAGSVLRGLLVRASGFLPGWKPSFPGAGGALLHIVSRYAEVLIQRLNQAPDKNKLAFLDLLGVEILPPQAARVPVAFQGIANLADGRIPARTRVGATVSGQGEPLVFETERAIALASARLAEVVTVWPARDACADHTSNVLAVRPFTLFEPLQPLPHALYFAHDMLFDFAGATTIEVEVALAVLAREPLRSVWEYWDGQLWRPFSAFDTKDADASQDGTRGFTRSGVVRLNAACGRAQKVTVNGVEAFWLRARPADPLPPTPGQVLPEIDRIRLRVVTHRPLSRAVLPVGAICLGGLEADRAFGGTARLDLTQTFFPFGRAPAPDTAFYFASQEVLSKPGAEVAVCYTRVRTPEEEADQLEAATLQKQAIAGILQTAADAARVAVAAAGAVTPLVEAAHPLHSSRQHLDSAAQSVAQDGDLDGLAGKMVDLAAAMAAAIAATESELGLWTVIQAQQLFPEVIEAVNLACSRGVDVLGDLVSIADAMSPAAADKVVVAARAAADILLGAAASMLEDPNDLNVLSLFDGTRRDALLAGIDALRLAQQATGGTAELPTLRDKASELADVIAECAASDFGPMDWFSFASMPVTMLRMAKAAPKAASHGAIVLGQLQGIHGLPGAGTVDMDAPQLPPPRVAWEYWNGTRWRSLFSPGTAPGAHFITSGEVSFTVPDDLVPAVVNGVEARFVRVRLTHGAFARLRMVRWSDPVSGTSNLMPIVEPRPPALSRFLLGYTYRSPTLAPERCLTHNDFRFEDHGEHARWPGPAFAPFRPTADLTPTLYLGFERALPPDLVSLYLDVVEDEGRPAGPRLAWEYWNGESWAGLAAEDDTRGLAVPGTVAAIWPGVPGHPPAQVSRSSPTSVHLLEPRDAARFRRGDLVSLRRQDSSELGKVRDSTSGVITLEWPLAGDYAQGTVQQATQPRFGVERTWLRGRYASETKAQPVRLAGIHPNTVWAAHLQTIENETLGSSDGEPSQPFFARHTPVLQDEVLEVRELEGARAAVELPLLQEELVRRGVPAEDLRTVKDARTGAVKEAWVRWRTRPHLFFSAAEDRHVLLERGAGRILFGDDTAGRVPPPGRDAVRLSRYRTGGGLQGNVAPGAIRQVLSGVAVQGVFNPAPGEGGADGEPAAEVLHRGPVVLRHRHQALSAADYEAMARQASPGVATARALPVTDAQGRPAPGWVRLAIVPQSRDARPRPTFELRERVHGYIRARAAATLAGLTVVPPEYLPVGVDAVVSVLRVDQAGVVRERVVSELAEFLHPLRGGPGRRGWPFGRSVHVSDVAATIERVAGVDCAPLVQLLLDGTPRGTVVEVPSDHIVVAGDVRVAVQRGER